MQENNQPTDQGVTQEGGMVKQEDIRQSEGNTLVEKNTRQEPQNVKQENVKTGMFVSPF